MDKMKTLTLGNTTFEIVDEQARTNVQTHADEIVTLSANLEEERTRATTKEAELVAADTTNLQTAKSYTDTKVAELNISQYAKQSDVNGQIDSLSSEKANTNHTQAASTITAGTFGGQVIANASGQSPSVSCLRNSKLVNAETNPTVNGEICWTYA